MLNKKAIIMLVIMGLFLVGVFIFDIFRDKIDPVCIKLNKRIEQEKENLNYCNTLNDCTEHPSCGRFFLNKNANLTLLRTLDVEYVKRCTPKLLPPLACEFLNSNLYPTTIGKQFAFIDCQEHKCIVRKTNDSLVCNLFEDKDNRNSCYHILGIITNDIQLCTKIEDQISVKSCIGVVLRNIAINTNNPSICSNINNTGFRMDCFREIASKLKNVSICDEATDPYSKLSCYLGIGWESPNSSICQKIPDEFKEIKRKCTIKSSEEIMSEREW